MTCAVHDCSDRVRSRGLCRTHYEQHRWDITHGNHPPRHAAIILAARPPSRPNPWAGRQVCPNCFSDDWTLPWELRLDDLWRCVSCGRDFRPVA